MTYTTVLADELQEKNTLHVVPMIYCQHKVKKIRQNTFCQLRIIDKTRNSPGFAIIQWEDEFRI